jgi:peptidoglycan hydrolase CwlO-like protein
MKKQKRFLLLSALGFVFILFFQVFSAGNGHVKVVKKNNHLTEKNGELTKKNESLKNEVKSISKKAESLATDLEQSKEENSLLSETIATKDAELKEVKTELKDEKNTNNITSGKQFNFEPIKIPDSEDN